MYLIISKDPEEQKGALFSLLRDLKAPVVTFSADSFSIASFLQEVETLPFLSSKKAVVIQAVELLGQEEVIALCRYLENPSKWVSLFLTASELPAQSKLAKACEKHGKTLRFKEEKPWDKEKKAVDHLVDKASQEGIRLAPQLAQAMVKQIDAPYLEQELEKLVCFLGDRREVTQEDLVAVSLSMPHETLWQLGDAILMRSAPQALQMGARLLTEGVALLQLLAGLRSQFVTGMAILDAEEKGEASQKFPYLKGKLLEKKIYSLKKYGKAALMRGALLIFETEVKAKNSSTDPALLLDLLIIKLLYDFIPSTQSLRSC